MKLKISVHLKAKKLANPIIVPENTWSQEQQQLLELAIVKYPKTTVGDRWSKISNSIPGKTREECLARYKHLVEIVKAQKGRARSDEQSVDDKVISEKVDDEKVEEVIEEPEDNDEVTEEPPKKTQSKGKPRNKRKDRKNRMDFSSDEEDEEEYDSN